MITYLSMHVKALLGELCVKCKGNPLNVKPSGTIFMSAAENNSAFLFSVRLPPSTASLSYDHRAGINT